MASDSDGGGATTPDKPVVDKPAVDKPEVSKPSADGPMGPMPAGYWKGTTGEPYDPSNPFAPKK